MIQNNQIILSIDTSMPICSVALQVAEDKFVLAKDTPRHQQSDVVLGLVREILEQQNVALKDLTAIAFAAGPGSFTGVRLAASIVQGLALANATPILKISSLAALAQHIWRNFASEFVFTLLPARRDEFYIAAYRMDAGGLAKELLFPKMCVLNELPWKQLVETSSNWSLIAPNLDKYEQDFSSAASNFELQLAWRKLTANGIAEDLLVVAQQLLSAGVKGSDGLPIYLENETAWQ